MTDAPHRITWEELCADPSLQDLPYRIELNGLNQIVMSPLPFRHGRFLGAVADLLGRLMPDGAASVAAAVLTSDNVKVPDAIWATWEFARHHADACALLVAPDICVEVLSPTNRTVEIDQKRQLYFESGAREVWICGLEARWSFSCPPGRLNARCSARSFRCGWSFESWVVGQPARLPTRGRARPQANGEKGRMQCAGQASRDGNRAGCPTI